MDFQHQVHESAIGWGADFFGIADLTPAREAVLEQGGTQVAQYPRSISVGITLFHAIVDEIYRRPDRAVATSYRSHCYDVINARLDQIISRVASLLQDSGFKVFPVPAFKRVDDERICGFSLTN